MQIGNACQAGEHDMAGNIGDSRLNSNQFFMEKREKITLIFC